MCGLSHIFIEKTSRFRIFPYNRNIGIFKREEMNMDTMKKLTTLFILLFVASISAGMVLKDAVPYAAIGGFGCATIFLLCSAYCFGKSRSQRGQ